MQHLFLRAGSRVGLAFFFSLLLASCDFQSNRDERLKSEAARTLAPDELTYEVFLAKASFDEVYFKGLCKLLLKKKVLFALEDNIRGAESATDVTTSKKLSIKVLKPGSDGELPSALLFSSNAALTDAAKKFNWTRSESGSYRFAVLDGKEAFQVLVRHQFAQVLLDAGSANALRFNRNQMELLAEGVLPSFYDPA